MCVWWGGEGKRTFCLTFQVIICELGPPCYVTLYPKSTSYIQSLSRYIVEILVRNEAAVAYNEHPRRPESLPADRKSTVFPLSLPPSTIASAISRGGELRDLMKDDFPQAPCRPGPRRKN